MSGRDPRKNTTEGDVLRRDGETRTFICAYRPNPKQGGRRWVRFGVAGDDEEYICAWTSWRMWAKDAEVVKAATVDKGAL